MTRRNNRNMNRQTPQGAVLALALTLILTLATACQNEPTATPPSAANTVPTTTATETATATGTATATATEAIPTPGTAPPATAEPTPTQITRAQKATAGPTTTETAGKPATKPGPPAGQLKATSQPAALTPSQQDCLPAELREGTFPNSILEVMSPHHAEIMKQAAACLSDEEIVRTMILPGITSGAPLPQDQANCIASSGTGTMIRTSLSLTHDFKTLDATLFLVTAHLALTAANCVPPDRYGQLFLVGTPFDRLKCITPTAERARALHAETIQKGPEPLEVAIEQAQPCLLQHPPEPLIEPLPECTQKQIDSGLPCRLD